MKINEENIKDSLRKINEEKDLKINEKNDFIINKQALKNDTLYNSNANSTNISDSKSSMNSPEISTNILSPNLNESKNIINNNNNISINLNSINNFVQNQQVQSIQQMFSRQNIIKALSDQNSTIYLQKQLRTISTDVIDYIINQLKGIFRDVIKDKNGNYFCNDLFKECTKEQRIVILNELYQSLSEDCLNNYACHPIQTLIDRASCELEYKLILTTFNDYNKLLFASLDPNGAYTIQKIIERIPDRYRIEFNFIFSSFIGFTSRKKYGIVTVKKFISETKSDKVTEQILQFIKQNFSNLAVDQYANYLISFLLEKWNNTSEGNEIKKLIKDNFVQLSQKKYSSFICESYIKAISKQEKQELLGSLDIDKIRRTNNHHSMKILKLLGVNNNNSNNNSYNNPNNNFNNNPNFTIQLPMSLNNNRINNTDFYMPNNNYPNFNLANNMYSRLDFTNNNFPNNNSGINSFNSNNFNFRFNNKDNNPNDINTFNGKE